MYTGLVPLDSPVDFAGDQLSRYIPALMSLQWSLSNSTIPVPAQLHTQPWQMPAWRAQVDESAGHAWEGLQPSSSPGSAGLREETINLSFPLLPPPPSVPSALPHHQQKGPWAHTAQKSATTFTQPLFSKPCIFKSVARLERYCHDCDVWLHRSRVASCKVRHLHPTDQCVGGSQCQKHLFLCHQRDELKRFHPAALLFVWRMKPLKSRFVVLPLSFFGIEGILRAHLTSCIHLIPSQYFFMSFRWCSFREDTPLPLNITSPGPESGSGAFCLKRLLPQPACQQLLHESRSVLQNKPVSLLPFYTWGEVI